MPPSTKIATRVLPDESFVIAIHGERSGRILRRVVVSEATAARICTWLDTGGAIVQGVADIGRAVDAVGRALDAFAPPRRKLPAKGRRG